MKRQIIEIKGGTKRQQALADRINDATYTAADIRALGRLLKGCETRYFPQAPDAGREADGN